MRLLILFLLRYPLRALRSSGAVLGLLLAAYCTLYALEGDRVASSLQHLNREVTTAQAKLADVQAEREKLERRVVAMRPSGIDPDLLDESARRQLGYSGPNEIILLNR